MSSTKWVRMPLSNIQPESGFAYIAASGCPKLSSHEKGSLGNVLEDGVPLPGPANALHDEIRKVGLGRFSFWHDFLYFSTSDNSNPITNGRRYEIVYPTVLGQMSVILARIFPWAVTEELRRYSPTYTCKHGGTVSTMENTTPGVYQYVPWLTGLWRRLGITVSTNYNLLDFGCGDGGCVDQFRKAGYSIFGCDLAFPNEQDQRLKDYIDTGIIRKIQADPYKIPFEDNSFDIISSNVVFEHVMDYDSTLAEIRRLIKPNGVGVHIFPGRWKSREDHIRVPFAAVIKSYWWLYFWALVGIRNEFQAGFSAKETARSNRKYLTENINYLSRKQICKYVRRYFHDCRFAEEAYFYPKHENLFTKYPFLLPLYRIWYGETEMRVLVFRNKK